MTKTFDASVKSAAPEKHQVLFKNFEDIAEVMHTQSQQRLLWTPSGEPRRLLNNYLDILWSVHVAKFHELCEGLIESVNGGPDRPGAGQGHPYLFCGGSGCCQNPFTRPNFYPDLAAYDDGQGTAAERWLYSHDEFGRQVRVERQTLDPQGAATESLVTAYEFNAAGLQARVASPEGVIDYEYDSLGRMTRTFTGTVANPKDDWLYTYGSLSRLARKSSNAHE